MKTDNFMGGRYLAEITHEIFSDLRDTKYQHSEPRLSIYGRTPDEWAKLAAWAVDHKIYSDNVRWLIQVPRLYSVYRKLGTVESFQVWRGWQGGWRVSVLLCMQFQGGCCATLGCGVLRCGGLARGTEVRLVIAVLAVSCAPVSWLASMRVTDNLCHPCIGLGRSFAPPLL